MVPKSVPQRMCVGCRQMKNKRELIRVVRSPEGELLLDAKGKLAGRGAYICPNKECLAVAVKSKALERALKVKISREIWDKIQERLQTDDGTTG